MVIEWMLAYFISMGIIFKHKFDTTDWRKLLDDFESLHF